MSKILILFLCFLHYSVQDSTSEGNSYCAAVVEYVATKSTTYNLRFYAKFIEVAAGQGADIIVFPEEGLTNSTTAIHVPFMGLLKEKPIPYKNPKSYDRLLYKLSKAARKHQIYVVVNLQEVAFCKSDVGENCKSGQSYEYYSTNVVFDRNGAVIDRYRKINLILKEHNTPGDELSFFKTDFGVTFGNVAGSDLEFPNPGLLLIQKHKITDFVNPFKTTSTTPFFLAGSLQSAYANSFNINLLAAGLNDVEAGSAGSGIYSGSAGALISIMPSQPTSRLLMAVVPKTPGQVSPQPDWALKTSSDKNLLKVVQDSSLLDHSSRLLVPGYHRFKLFDKGTACTFDVVLVMSNNEKPGHYYRAFAFDGIKPTGEKTLGLVACGITSCKTEDVSSCGYIHNKTEQNVELKEVEIEMMSYKPKFDPDTETNDLQYFPDTLKSDKYFFQPSEFYFNYHGDAYAERLIFALNKPTSDIVSFGILGRVFGRDT